MKISEVLLGDIKVIESVVHGDHRGWFMESYSKRDLKELGIEAEFVQDNISYSAKKGTLRGLHFQNNPYAQAKLVRCTKGAIMDIAVDLRQGSPYYLQWVAIELSEDNFKSVYIPRGFAHGFVCLTNQVEFQYKVDNYYASEYDRGIRYDDPMIHVDWESLLNHMTPILSDKDKHNPSCMDSDCNFRYGDD